MNDVTHPTEETTTSSMQPLLIRRVPLMNQRTRLMYMREVRPPREAHLLAHRPRLILNGFFGGDCVVGLMMWVNGVEGTEAESNMMIIHTNGHTTCKA